MVVGIAKRRNIKALIKYRPATLFPSKKLVSIRSSRFFVRGAYWILTRDAGIWHTLLLLTYLLTPWCRVLLEKLTGLQLVEKFPAFHGTRSFITVLTSVLYMSLSWANPIQSIYAHPTSWRSILILSTHLRLGLRGGLFPSGFPTKNLHDPLLTHTRHMPCPSHSSRFYQPHNIGRGVQIT